MRFAASGQPTATWRRRLKRNLEETVEAELLPGRGAEGPLVGLQGLGGGRRRAAGVQDVADGPGRELGGAEGQRDALSREGVVEAGGVSHEEGPRGDQGPGLHRQGADHTGPLREVPAVETLGQPWPP
jgi:hypothetical protein